MEAMKVRGAIVECQLNISISATDLNMIYQSGQSITICKKFIKPYISAKRAVAPPATTSNDGPYLTWLALQPLQENKILWTSDYAVYATATAISAGNVIAVNASAPAQIGLLYSFANGHFSASASVEMAQYYNIENAQTTSMNFGLAQSATANGTTINTAPINCVNILYNQQGNFQTSETVFIFLSNTDQNGSFIPRIPTTALQVIFNAQTTSANVGFNGSTNSFYLQTSS
jgi:hypothetical protein